MKNKLYKKNLFLKMSDFTLKLFIFNVILDPGNGLLHMKQITFFLALFFNFKRMKIEVKHILMLSVIYAMYFISTGLMLLRGIQYDPSFTKSYMMTFLTLLIFFIDYKKIELRSIFIFSSIIISLITIVIALLIINFPVLYIPIEGNSALRSMFLIGEKKQFLFWTLIMVFHVSSPILILAYSMELYDFFRAEHKKKKLLIIIILALGLFFTGTRANIFSLALMTIIVYLDFIYFTKKRIFATSVIIVFLLVVALCGTYMLMTMKNDSSNVKDLHLLSYIELFNQNPSYILFGTGPGSLFYTKGFHGYATNTELTYFELIRMFGIFFAVIFIFIYMTPYIYIKKIGKNRNLVYGMAYLAYLCIAGTNPYLIGPTGFLTFWLESNFLRKENMELKNG